MDETYVRTETTVSLINYHFVFCPRYRRRVIVGDVEARLKEIIAEACASIECRVIALETMPDHVHLFVNASPQLSPADIMGRVKGRSSAILRREFPHLHHLRSVWTRSYYCGTAGTMRSETVRHYVDSQKKRG